MNEQITLTYKLKNPLSWDEIVEINIPISELADYMQITKVLASMISFFIKCGYDMELISEAYTDIASQLANSTLFEENPNYNSSEEEIDTHIKDIEKYFTVTDMTLVKFKEELKNEAFIQYIYQIYLDDSDPKVVN